MGFNQGIMSEATKQIFSDNKRTVTLYRATKTESNTSGTESIAYGAAESIEIVFFKIEEKFEYGPEGLVEKGNCMLFDKPNNINIARDDKIVVDNETFLIKTVDLWRSRGEHIYTFAVGYLV